MINAIIQGIFNLVMMIFNAITTPIFSLVFSLFPSLSTFFGYITSFLNMSLTYVVCVSNLLLFTNTMFVALFDYFIIKYSIFLGLKAYKLFITVYNKFKV